MTDHKRLVDFARTAILVAIILILSFTPLGYLKAGVIEITILMLPIAVGSILISPAAGAVLGFVFGLTSLWFATPLLAINAILAVVTCIVPRVLAGYLCGVIARAIKNKTVSCVVGSLSASLLNTVLFTVTLLALFSKSDYIMGMMGGMNILKFAVALVGINGVVEAIAVTLLGSIITRALIKSGAGSAK